MNNGSNVDSHSARYAANVAAATGALKTLNARLEKVAEGGSERARQRHAERGKLAARDRIDAVVDVDTPFIELSPLAAYGQYDDKAPAAGLVTGIGIVAGAPYMFLANDATVKGGSMMAVSMRKYIRAQDIAAENGIGCIYLVDSGGAYLPEQDQVFPDRDHFGGSFYRQAKMSAAGLPQLSVVLGGCTAGGAYVPALSDEVIMVEGIGRIYLGGPPIVRAALGEEVDDETLGGAAMHASVSGVADYRVSDEHSAYGLLRKICASTNQRRADYREDWASWQTPAEPIADPQELYGIIESDPRHLIDPYAVIARLVDSSEFHEFKPEWGATLTTGFAHIWGFKVGILANNGILFSEAALKATHFIELCEQRNVPLLFLQNTSGYMVGTDAEKAGIAKHGSQMVAAVANTTVPKYTVLIGSSYGAGNYGMCGRGLRPRFLFSWPNSRIATMAPETAATVLGDIRKAGLKGKTTTEADIAEIRDEISSQFETFSDPYYATSRLWDDGILDPVKTRDVLGLCLSLAARGPKPGTGDHPVDGSGGHKIVYRK